MKRSIPDFYLLHLTLLCVGSAFALVMSWESLPSVVRQVLFFSAMLSPSLILYGGWRFCRKQGGIYPLACIVGGLVSSVVLIWPIASFFLRN